MLFLAGPPMQLLAQNWEPFPHERTMFEIQNSAKHFYLPLNKNGLDSFKSISYSNFYNHLKDDVINNFIDSDPLTAECVSNGEWQNFFWLETYHWQNKKLNLTSGNKSIIIDFYQNSSFNISGTNYYSSLDSLYSNGNDSLALFRIYHSASNNVIINSEVILSKLKGIIEMPITKAFPIILKAQWKGKLEDIYPYKYGFQYLNNLHHAGDEIHYYYKDNDVEDDYFSTSYVKVIYDNIIVDTINHKITTQYQEWSSQHQSFIYNNQNYDTVIYNTFPNPSYKITQLSQNKDFLGKYYFLDSNSSFHFYSSYNTTLQSGKDIYFWYQPHIGFQQYFTNDFMTDSVDAEKRVVYSKINGVESGIPLPDSIFMELSTQEQSTQPEIRIINNQITLLNPEKYLRGIVLDIQGKYVENLEKNDLNKPIDFSDKSKGVYLLKLEDIEGNIGIKKFIIR
jgi:hypothetical protein